MEKGVLVVMPYKHSKALGNEIKISLNAWKKFCTFNYHFIVIGEVPYEIKQLFSWVEFIDCKSKLPIKYQYNPHLDILHKLELVMDIYADLYNGFIRIADDVYAIKPFTLEDITTFHYNSLDNKGIEERPVHYWIHDKWKTRQLLDRENLPHIDYTIHYPYYFEFDKLKEIWDKYNMRNESYVLEDIYFNYFEHKEPILDSSVRLMIRKQETYVNKFENALNNPNIKFVNNSVDGWSKELENRLFEIIK